MRRTRVAVAALVVAGLVLVGVGASGHVRGRLCEETTVVGVTPTAADPDVAAADLPPADRAVVATAVAENRTGLAGDVGIANGTVVAYEGAAYRVRVGSPRDCAPAHPVRVRLPLGLGGAAVVAGGLAAGFISLRGNRET